MSETAATDAERRVLAEAPSGELIDLGKPSGEQSVIAADVIRRLCVGKNAKCVNARGIRIKGARIVGRLDLSVLHMGGSRIHWRFHRVSFEETPDLTGACCPPSGSRTAQNYPV